MSAFFATCPKGLEYLLRDELMALGAEAHEVLAGVRFTGDLTSAYRACLESRLASRILLTLAEFPARDAGALYVGVRGVDWSRHFGADTTLAIDATGSSGRINHSGFAAQRVKDAIVDQCRERCDVRPSIRMERPAVRLNLLLHHGRATLSLDLSGEPLHRRGWRHEQGAAPLKENLACAMLLRAGWPDIYARGGALVDPMCGSGTLLVEAAWMAAGVAPGLHREYFGFLGWRGHDTALWDRLWAAADARAAEGLRGLRACLFGSDGDPRSIAAATRNLQTAGLAGFAHLDRRPVEHLEPPAGFATGLVITNPPYGERVGEASALPALYGAFGARLRAGFSGWRAAVITSDAAPAQALGLRAAKRYVLFNGALQCRLALYELHAPTPTGAAIPLSPGAQMVANRIRKNVHALRRGLARDGVTCFRAYDADLPEYAAAIDVYRGWPEAAAPAAGDGGALTWLDVQEYAPPASIDAGVARTRWHELLRAAGAALEVPRERIVPKTRRRSQGRGQYRRVAARNDFLVVEEGGLRFRVNLRDRIDTGLFLDHRLVRARVRQLARGGKILNLFAYTGAASVYAAAGGARHTTSVDLSRTNLEWASRNLVLNGFGGDAHELVQADALAFLDHDHQHYGLIFVDPPTFSNSKRAADFDVQRDHLALLMACKRRLRDDGTIIFSNHSRRFELDVDRLSTAFAIEDIGPASVPKDFARRPRIHGCWLLHKR